MQKQTLWGTVLFTLLVLTVMSIFVMIALQMNTLNTLDRQEKTLTAISEQQQERPKIVIQGTIPLDDSDNETDKSDTETSNDSTISVEELDTFVEDDDIVVEEKIVIHNDKVTEKTFSEKIVSQNMELPDLPTDRKVCTDYRVYNIPGTPHNRLQNLACTDELGCRKYGEYYIVGVGSAYANRIGETFEVELETGVVFKIITGDMKPDDDTDATNRFEACYNYDGEYCANVLEFIMDKEIFDIKAYQWGGVDYYEKFKGNIVRMTYLGRDESADWDSYY